MKNPLKTIPADTKTLTLPTTREMRDLHETFYLQSLSVSLSYAELPREDLFAQFCKGKTVLHIGCTQHPITNINTSLHLKIAKHCKQLDGYDIDQRGYAILAPHINNGRFLESLSHVERYDLILIPEVLEHVGDPQSFLATIDTIEAREIIITVPDVFQCLSRHFSFETTANDAKIAEAVHPDHNYWFTPYTLSNLIKKYTPWHLEGLYWINRLSIMAHCSK